MCVHAGKWSAQRAVVERMLDGPSLVPGRAACSCRSAPIASSPSKGRQKAVLVHGGKATQNRKFLETIIIYIPYEVIHSHSKLMASNSLDHLGWYFLKKTG